MAIDWDAMVLAPLMGAGVFGEAAAPTYMPKSGAASFTIDGVFDNAFTGVRLTQDGIPEFQTVNPVLGVRLSQFPSPPTSGDRVFVPSVGRSYFVNEVKPDGHGWAKLELSKAA